MVAPAKPISEAEFYRAAAMVEQMRILRPQAKLQADKLKVAAFSAREDAKRLASFPDAISPGDFRQLKQSLTELLTEAANCLDHNAVMLDTLAGK
jgi:hypothetical protein